MHVGINQSQPIRSFLILPFFLRALGNERSHSAQRRIVRLFPFQALDSKSSITLHKPRRRRSTFHAYPGGARTSLAGQSHRLSTTWFCILLSLPPPPVRSCGLMFLPAPPLLIFVRTIPPIVLWRRDRWRDSLCRCPRTSYVPASCSLAQHDREYSPAFGYVGVGAAGGSMCLLCEGWDDRIVS